MHLNMIYDNKLLKEKKTRKDKLENMYRDEKTLDGRMTCNYQDCNLEFFQKKCL